MSRILAVCHGVMYKQLAAWMLHGLLLDQSEEFFVRQGSSTGGAAMAKDWCRPTQQQASIQECRLPVSTIGY